MPALEQLVDHRRRLVGDNVRRTNRLTSALKNSFPQVLQWFADQDPTMFCDFLAQWPTLKAVPLARRTTLDGFFRAQRHPGFPLFAALPGAGAVFAPRLLVAFGEPRHRDTSADELQKYAGVAPVTERSGNKSWGHWRLQCPTFLRPTCVEWAAASTQHSFWARTYSQQPRDKGASHQAAVRALAFTWIRMLLRCWPNRTP
jgi:hypothetical protein